MSMEKMVNMIHVAVFINCIDQIKIKQMYLNFVGLMCLKVSIFEAKTRKERRNGKIFV